MSYQKPVYDETQRDEVWGSHPAIRPSVPVLLHVSHETRALALKHYELSFEWKLSQRSEVAQRNPPGLASSAIALPPSFFAAAAAQQQQSDERQQQRPSSSPPRTWFNFGLDAMYLVGELEPYDMPGASRPMPYFVAAEVLVCVTKRDGIAHARIGHETWLVDEKCRHRGAAVRRLDADVAPLEVQRPAATGTASDEENGLQKIWREWYRYSVDTWVMGNVRFPLIHESDLAYHVYDFMVTTPAK